MSGQNQHSPALAIIGMGPRGISVVERIAAELRAHPRAPLTLHLIDDSEIGAGRIWDPSQTRTLCMNTLAGAVTLFTEPESTVAAPVFEGPIQYEWIRLLRGEREGIAEAKLTTFDNYPPNPQITVDFAAEIAESRPESHPSRAFYGAYLHWCFEVALRRLPAEVTVIEHHTRVVGIQEAGNRDVLTLDDASEISADATVLAVGWLTPGPNNEERELAAAVDKHPELTWIRPGNPVEQSVDQIPEEGTVLVRGLGMGFFDLMALLTFDRGGRFIEDAGTRSGLRYEASGREPHLVVSSYRGYPYLPKSAYGGLPPKPELRRLKKVISSLPTGMLGPASIDFDQQVWPAIVRDSYEAYYRTLHHVKPHALNAPVRDLIDALDRATPEQVNAAAARFIPDPANRFDLFSWEHALAGKVAPRSEFTEYLAQRLVGDIADAAAGVDSPLKAGLWSVSASRKPSQILGAEGRYTFESRRNRFAALMSIGQMAGSGPPLFRTRQLLALVDAGLVSFLGAEPKLRVDGVAGEFVMKSPNTDETLVFAHTLVDAWMHQPDIRRSADPLAKSLRQAGRTRPFHDTTTNRERIATGSPEVDPDTRLLVRADQQPDKRLHLIGIPTYAQLPDTTISPMPGTNPLLLQETDKVARHALAVAFGVV
ncbi:FAD/NAD(P)-binding protein [Corynebacterium sp. A21]|uniref:FAD/NAD(P)-binding protein n=1 Tax=Corynebacterium sp. A21 TaxID=3457318 RepID=UPI003FCFE5BF